MADDRQGISNRETAAEEAEERRELPPLEEGAPGPQGEAGKSGEIPLDGIPGRQTSLKTGSRSGAQKAGESRYPEQTQPPAGKVGGAFGKEPE